MGNINDISSDKDSSLHDKIIPYSDETGDQQIALQVSIKVKTDLR